MPCTNLSLLQKEFFNRALEWSRIEPTCCYLHETEHESEAAREMVPLVLPIQLLESWEACRLYLRLFFQTLDEHLRKKIKLY